MLVILFLSSWPSVSAGPVVISEVLADNRGAAPVAGRFPDFIELQNITETTIDLSGGRLSDDGTTTTALVFPLGTRLGPGARLVVWCDRDPGLPAPQSLSEKSDGPCFHKKGWMARRDEGAYPTAVCDRGATKPAGPFCENPPGDGSFGRVLRWLDRHSPLRGCSGLAASASPKIPRRMTHPIFQTGSQAGFGVGASGDRIQLAGPDGLVWDVVAFGLQVADRSIARLEGSDPTLNTWRLSEPTPGASNREVPLGSPDHLYINEWMASPASGDDWIEVYNADTRPVSLSGIIITDRRALPPANRPIPDLSFIAARGHGLFFASDQRQTTADHLDFRLSAGGEELTLVGPDRVTILDRITFGAQVADTSTGRTPDGGEGLMEFPTGRATPGASNGRQLTRVIVSEVLTHADPPFEDAIELHNPTSSAVDISHWWLSDASGTPKKYRIPPGTGISPGGYLVLYQYQFSTGPTGFSLNSYEGDEVWVSVGDAAGNLTGERGGVRFGAARNGVSLGIVSTSTGTDFAPLARPTFGVDHPSSLNQFRQGRGSANSPFRVPEAVLAEWSFGGTPLPATGLAEPFVEILNPGPQALPLFDPLFPANAWRLRGDLRLDLPAGVTLEPGERCLVVGFDPSTALDRLAAFRTAHSIASKVRIFGPWSGTIGDEERILELQAPDFPETADSQRPGFVPYVRVDRIEFRPDSGWPHLQDIADRALRRTEPAGHGNDPQSWILDRPSPGSAEPNDSEADWDRDGLPDAWERTHGFDSENAEDSLGDADSDGATQLEEFRAGTHPRNATDVFRVQAQMNGGGSVQLRFRAIAGRTYVVEARPWRESTPWRTAAGPWTPSDTREQLVEILAEGEPQILRVTIPHSP